MKNSLINGLGFVLVGALVYWILHHAPGAEALSGHASYLSAARKFHADAPVLSVLLFCAAHLICSATGIPGGCTVLNITAGATFGFWRGCAIVYPVTLLSASLVYLLAFRLRGISLFRRYETQLEWARRHLQRRDYWYLVSLRLSPLLPFGALNLLFGVLRLPFWTYFLTTAVGIFFDVTLLNSLGASTMADGSPQSHTNLVIAFFILLVLFLFIRRILPKPLDDVRQVA